MRSIALFVLALGLMACDDDLRTAQEGFTGNDVTGVVHMPLSARGTDGKNYRLRNATFEITGAAMFTVSDRDAQGPDADSLATTLPAGSYSVYLRPGWQLVLEGEDGIEQPAEATLASSNPLTFEIGRTLDARVKLTLHTGEQDLLFGASGPVRVTSLGSSAESAL